MAATGLATGRPRYRPHRARRPGLGVDRGRALPSLAVPEPVADPAAPDEGVSGTPTVLYQVDAGVARVTINRPERRNAMSWEVMRGLRRVLAAAAQDDERPGRRPRRRRGRGLLRGGRPREDDRGRRARGRGCSSVHEARGVLAEVFGALWELGKPTVARVQGFAMAGRLRAGARLRPGRGLGAGPLRRPRGQRRPVALHDHRPPRPLDAAQEGARADAHRPGGRRRRGDCASAS